jgi:hypothetical protein
MVLILTAVVGLAILGIGVTIAVIEIRDPTVDTSGAGTVLVNLISTILGALLGLLAGRTQMSKELSETPIEKEQPKK